MLSRMKCSPNPPGRISSSGRPLNFAGFAATPRSCSRISNPHSLPPVFPPFTLLHCTSMGKPVRPLYACRITLARASSTERTMARVSASGKCNTSAARSTVARTRQSASGLLFNSSFSSSPGTTVSAQSPLSLVFVAFPPRTPAPVLEMSRNSVVSRLPGGETMPCSQPTDNRKISSLLRPNLPLTCRISGG
jgi:hypothetical protein